MTEPVSSEETMRLWARLMRVQRRLLAAVEAEMKTAGLPPLEWYDVLLELERAGEAGLRPFELTERMLLERYNVSRLADRLEGAGLVRRMPSPEDRRGHRLAITPAGVDLRRLMWPVYRRAVEAHFGEPLGHDGAAALAEALARLSRKP